MPIETPSLALQTKAPAKQLSIEPLTGPMLERMEETQLKLARHVDKAKGPYVDPTYNFRNVPMDIQTEALQIVDKISEKIGREPLSRRLLRLNEKVAAATERYIFSKKEKEFEKKNKIEGQVGDLKSGKNTQGWCQAGGGFGTAVLSLVGAFFTQNAPNTGIGQILSSLSGLTPQGANALVTWLEGNQLPLDYDQRFFLSTVQSDKQTLEGLKKLPDEIRQFVLDLVRLELRAVEGMGRG